MRVALGQLPAQHLLDPQKPDLMPCGAHVLFMQLDA